MYLLPVRYKHKTYVKLIKDEFGNVCKVDTSICKIQGAENLYTKHFSTIILESKDYDEIIDTHKNFKKEQGNDTTVFQYNLNRAAIKHIEGYMKWYFPINDYPHMQLCKEDWYSNQYPKPLKFINNWDGKGDLDTHFQVLDIRNCLKEFQDISINTHTGDSKILNSVLVKPVIDDICQKYGLICNDKGEITFIDKNAYWVFIKKALNETIVKDFNDANINVFCNYNMRGTFDYYSKIFKLTNMNIIRDEEESDNAL